MSERIASFVLRTINRLNRVRDSIYLDTNAWSSLAKGLISPEPAKAWANQKGYHFWMARFQLAELSRDTRLAAPLSLLLKDMPVVVLDYGQNDLQGQPWHKTPIAYDEWIHLTTEELIREFISQLREGPIQAAAISLRKDAEAFGASLQAALASLPSGAPRRWADFPERLNSWIRARCELNGVAVNEEALGHPDCYVGLRLAYGVLFSRYYMGCKCWVLSDYIDYLQTSDIAYAGIVVTERNLSECIRQLSKRPEVTAPELVADLSWLAHPTNAPQP